MSLERFTEWYPRYREAFKDPVYRELYDYLASPQNIYAMSQACEAGKPALSGVVKDLERKFSGRFDFDNPMNRRMIGSMIKEIIYDFGYRRKGQRLVSNSSYFSTASYYEWVEEQAKKTVCGLFEIKDGETGFVKEKEVRGEVAIAKNSEVDTGAGSKGYDCPVCEEENWYIKNKLNRLTEIIEDENCSDGIRRDAIKKIKDVGSEAIESIAILEDKLYDDSLFNPSVKTLAELAGSINENYISPTAILHAFAMKLRSVSELSKRYSESKKTKITLIEAIGKIGPPGTEDAAEALSEALYDENSEVREAAARALSTNMYHYFRIAAPALVDAMQDVDEEVRMAAANALGSCPPINLDLLTELLEHENYNVRRAAVLELGEIGGYGHPEPTSGLINVLKSKDPHMRALAAWALGSQGKDAIEAVDPLKDALEDESCYVREKATWALGCIGSTIERFDRSVFFSLLSDENKIVRQAAAWALGNIPTKGDHLPLQLLLERLAEEKDSRVREKVIWAVGELTPNSALVQPALPFLTEALSDQDWAIRKAAATALGKIRSGASDALPVLNKLHDDFDEKKIVRYTARWAIEEISKSTKNK